MLGRQAVAATEYVRDDSGQVIGHVTTWEPRWLEEDTAWAKAFLQWKADQCPGCGFQLAETTAMRNGDPVHSYTVPPPARCWACDARLKAQEEDRKKPSKRPEARMWVVEQES